MANNITALFDRLERKIDRLDSEAETMQRLTERIDRIQDYLENKGFDGSYRYYANKPFRLEGDPTEYNLGWGDTDDGNYGFIIRFNGLPPGVDCRLPKRPCRILLTEARPQLREAAVDSSLEEVIDIIENDHARRINTMDRVSQKVKTMKLVP